jgi:hypothetical protein
MHSVMVILSVRCREMQASKVMTHDILWCSIFDSQILMYDFGQDVPLSSV